MTAQPHRLTVSLLVHPATPNTAPMQGGIGWRGWGELEYAFYFFHEIKDFYRKKMSPLTPSHVEKPSGKYGIYTS